MKAFQINKYGDNSELKLVDVSIPQPLPHQVLVQLRASSVNPVDYKIRSGFLSANLPKTFPFTLGWEGAGIIKAIGDEVKSYSIGDEVMLMANFLQGGTYAEFVAVNTSEIMLKPQNIPFFEAAVLPFSLGTALTALLEDAKITSGKQILIHGAGGAVGQMAVQISKETGLYVIGTATGENINELELLGVDKLIDYSTTEFDEVVKDVDVVLDLVGGAILEKSYPILKVGGIVVSTTQAPNPEALKKFGIRGKMTQTRADVKLFESISKWVSSGKIKVKTPQDFPFENAPEALALVENRQSKSKIVLRFEE